MLRCLGGKCFFHLQERGVEVEPVASNVNGHGELKYQGLKIMERKVSTKFKTNGQLCSPGRGT